MPKQINVKLGFEADTSQAKKQIQDLQKSLDSLMTSSTKNTALKDFSKDMVEAQQSAVKLKSILGESMNLDTGRLDLVKFNQQLQDSGLTLSKLGSQLASLGPEGKQAFLSLADSIVTAQKPMIETNRLLDGMWTALKNTARWQLSSSMLHGFISALNGAYGYAQDLNASLNSIRIVSGQSVEQMAAFAEQANRSAQALSTSTLAYTDAALIFYQQGLRGDDVTDRVETVLKLSNVTGDSAEQISSYMTAIWNNFYDGSQSLESFADKITALGAATASSSAEIAAGLQQFAAVGNTIGLSYDYAATALATIIAQTRQSESTVGNSLRTIFSRLSSLKQGGIEDGVDLTKYTKALQEVGVNVLNQNGELKEMDQILDDIGSKWDSLSRSQQIALAQTVGGVRQYTNLIALFDNWDKFQQNLLVTQGAEGTLQEQADIYAESWEAARKRVQAAWQSIYQDLIDDKFFIKILNGIANVLKGVDGLIDAIGGLKGVLIAAGVAATTLLGKQLEVGVKSAVTNLNKIFYGDKIADKMADNAVAAAKEQLSTKAEDQGQNTIIENQIFQIEQNKELRKLRQGLKDDELEYYQALLKTSGELAKQSALSTENSLSINKQLREAQQGALYKLYTSNVESGSEKEKQYERILSGQDETFNKLAINADDSAGIKIIAQRYQELAKDIGLSSTEFEKLISLIRQQDQAIQEDNINLEKTKALEDAIRIAREEGISVHNGLLEGLTEEANKLMYNAELKKAELLDIDQSSDEYKELETEIDELVKKYEKLNDIISKIDSSSHIPSVNNPEDNMPGLKIDEQKIVKGAQAVSQLTMAITSFSNIVNVLRDDSIPITEKFTRTITSLTMALPAAISGVTNLAKAFGLVSKDATFMAALTALGPYILTIGPIIAALGVVAWGISKGINGAKDALNSANKSLEEATQKAEETKQAYENLKSTFESYNDLKENLSEMDELDRAQAISEMNSEMLDLILNTENWSEAFKDGIQYDENGLIKVDELQQELLRKEEAKAYFAAQRLETEAKIAQLHAQEAVDDKNTGLNITAYREHNIAGGSGKQDRTSDVIDALAGAGLTSFADLAKEYREEFNKLSSGNLTEAEDKEIRENLSKIREQLDKQNNDIKQALVDSGLFSDEEINDILPQIDQIISNDDSLNALVEAILNHLSNDTNEDVLQDQANRAYLSSVENKNSEGKIYNGFNELDSESQQKVLDWYQTLDDTQKKVFEDAMAGGEGLVETIQSLGGPFDELTRKIESTNEVLHGGLFDSDVDEEEFANLSEFLSEYGDKIEGLSAQVRASKEDANDIAEAILRFDDAIQDVTEHYDDWMHTLNSGSVQDKAEAISQLKDAYADMLDISEDAFKNIPDFLEDTENLNLMKQAAEGSAEAYQHLQENLQNEILAKVGLDASDFESKYNDVLSMSNDILKDIEIGAYLDNTDVIQGLNEIINAMNLTEAEAEALLSTLGWDADVEQVEVPETQKQALIDAEPKVSYESVEVPNVVQDGTGGTTVDSTTVQVPTINYDPVPELAEEEGEKTVTMLRIKSAKKSAGYGGGKFKYNNSRHGGGTKGPSASKGKSGGGGSSAKKKTTKEHKKPEQKTDRYHDIKERIADLNTELKRLEKTESRVYGKAKLKYMDQEIKKLEKQIELTDEYIDEIKKYAKEDQARLRGIGMGATFDDNGRLNNYEQVLANIVASYNSAVATYNGAVDTFNASAQEDADNARLEAADKALAAAKETYDERLKILDQYEDTFNLLQEKWDERIDQVWELFDKKLEQVTWRIEFELDWNEKELEHFDWLLKYVGKDADKAADAIANLSKQMGVYEESIAWAKEGISEIFGLHGIDFDFDNADPDTLYDQLAASMQLMQAESQLTEKEAEALLTYMETLRDSYDGMYDSWIEAHDRMMNAWDEWQDRLKEGIDDIAQYGKELEGIQKIVDLTGRKMLKMTTNDLNRMHQAMVTNAQENLRAATARRDALEPEVQAAEAHLQELIEKGAGEVAIQLARDEYRQMVEDLNDATNDWYSAFADALQAGEDAFEAFIENTTTDYKEAFGKMDLDYMQEQFKRQKDVRDLYLDDYEKYHELNKTAQELNKSLAATNSDLIRGKLLDLQDDINGSMQTGVQISAAQAEIYARRLALLQAEAELLDAQNAKSAVRMTRDNEGNFSYTYTADQDQIGAAQENYGDKFFELLDYERNYADQIQEEMLDSFQEFIDRRNEIAETYKDDEEAYTQAMEDLREEYLAYMDYYVGELDMDLYEMARLRDDDWLDFQNITQSKLAEHDDFITQFHDTIVGNLMPDYQTAGQLAQQWRGVMEESCRAADKAVSNFQKNTQTTYEHAGENIETYGLKVNTKFDEMAQKSSDTADAVEDMGQDMVETMAEIQSEAYELDNTWAYVMDAMRNQIDQTINALYELMQKLDETTAHAQATIAAVSAAAALAAASGFNTGISDDYGNYNSGEQNGSLNNGDNPYVTGNSNGKGRSPLTKNKGLSKDEVNKALADIEKNIIKWGGQSRKTGGYVGEWGSEGKLFMLHEKEFVLNAEDTKNIFEVVNAVRSIMDMTSSNGMINSLALAAGGVSGSFGSMLDQNVHIEANFPNVQSHTEIEMAINNLINSASQYVNRKS